MRFWWFCNLPDVLKLKKLIDSISPNQGFSFPIHETSKFRLGELQSDYNTFAKAFQDEKLFTRLQPYAPENLAANQSISEYKGRISTLKQKKKSGVCKIWIEQKKLSTLTGSIQSRSNSSNGIKKRY